MDSNEMLDNWKSKYSVHYSNIKRKDKKVKTETNAVLVERNGKRIFRDSDLMPTGTEMYLADEGIILVKKGLGDWFVKEATPEQVELMNDAKEHLTSGKTF